jgi:signal peptidase I
MSQPEHQPHATVIETMQSLIVAFVLAMTFRGFVTEGFVIPTGSMAPTLLGEHVLLHSRWTGATYPVGVDQEGEARSLEAISDPVLGPGFRSGTGRTTARHRMGDRILVLKVLYPFAEPDRFDVVVFKNPTDPEGKSANYIKRLIGLPGERVLLADGDVFAARGPDQELRIQRKPPHVQRAVWQMVHASDLVPVARDELNQAYAGPPWRGEGWDTGGRVYRCATASPSTLRWDHGVRGLNDWTSYNAVTPADRHVLFPVSDLRVTAGVVAEDPAALEMALRIQTRQHVLELGLEKGVARVRMRPAAEPEGWVEGLSEAVSLPEGDSPFNVEFWHADQALSLYLDGERVAYLAYDWPAAQRMTLAAGAPDWRDARELAQDTSVPQVSWTFSGTPVTLHRVRTDRDLHYRPARMHAQRDGANPPGGNGAHAALVEPGTYAFGTHPQKPAVLGPNHYFMLGDNSQASLDSRLWGHPHPFISEQVDDAPFVVNRRLIIGKAWVVYFPAPFAVRENWLPVVPDFGRLRFIR